MAPKPLPLRASGSAGLVRRSLFAGPIPPGPKGFARGEAGAGGKFGDVTFFAGVARQYFPAETLKFFRSLKRP